jgi:selenocysteine lyase/cysteine desulfurase
LPPADSAIVSIPGTQTVAGLHRAGIRASVRAGAVRVGFHLYNSEADLDRLLEAL